METYVDDCLITTGAAGAGFLLLIGDNNQLHTGANRGEILSSDPEVFPNLKDDRCYWHDLSVWVTYFNLAFVYAGAPIVLMRVERNRSIREWARVAATITHECNPLIARGVHCTHGLAAYIPDGSLTFSLTADLVCHVRGCYERR